MSWLDKYKTEKFPDGGKVQPYITNNPNDPRLIAYVDSLSAYNNSQKNIKDANTGIFNFGSGNNIRVNPKKATIRSYDALAKLSGRTKSEWLDGLSFGFGRGTYNRGTDKTMLPENVINYPNEKWYNILEQGFVANYKKPVQPVILQQPKKELVKVQTKNQASSNNNTVVKNKQVVSQKPTLPITPSVKEIVSQNVVVEQQPIVEPQTPIITQPLTQQLPKNDFRQYLQPRGFSRQGQGSESQSQSFYDANGKMTGQIINGQYVPTEFGKFLESGMSEDEYLKSLEAPTNFKNGGQVKWTDKYK